MNVVWFIIFGLKLLFKLIDISIIKLFTSTTYLIYYDNDLA